MKPITIMEAHLVLAEILPGGDKARPPLRRTGDPASGRQLWSLNKSGRLRLIDTPDADDQPAHPERDEPPASAD